MEHHSVLPEFDTPHRTQYRGIEGDKRRVSSWEWSSQERRERDKEMDRWIDRYIERSGVYSERVT